MTTLAGLLVLLAAAPPLEVRDGSGCVTAAGLAAELDALMPDGPGPDAPLQVRVTVAAEGDARALALVVEGATPEAVLLQRDMALTSADCAASERLLAQILVRRFEALPRDLWARPPSPPPPPPEPSRWRGALTLGAVVGVDRPEVRGELAGGVGLRLAGPLYGVGELRVGVSQPLAVGEGQARLVRGAAALGVGVAQPLGRVELLWSLGVAGGVQVARGLAFDRAETVVLPVADAGVEVRLLTPWVWTLAVAAETPLVGARLRQAGHPGVYRDPAVRVRIAMGISFF